MGYVGNQTTNSYSSMDKQTIIGDGGASYTLTHAVANAQEIEVFVNNVRQEAGVAYTVNGTALSMTGNVASTDDFYVIYQGKALQTVVPPDGSVSTAKLASGAVTTAKLDTPIGIETTSSTFKMTDLTSNVFYRTGTFTPSFSSTSATDQDVSIVSAYDEQYGFYTRIGDLVHTEGTITTNSTAWSFTNGGATGQNLTIVGLPFNIKNSTDYYPNISVGNFHDWTGWTTGFTPMGYGVLNTKRITMAYAVANGSTNILTTYIYAVGSSITFSMTYQTDDA